MQEVLAFCEPLPRYKRPRKVFLDHVPRNPTGKIEKPKLRKQYSWKGRGVQDLTALFELSY